MFLKRPLALLCCLLSFALTAGEDTKKPVDKKPAATLKPLTEAEQTRLLGARFDGGMSGSFRNFSNMFIVNSALAFGQSVGLMTSSKEVMQAPLMSPFPESYKPTMREFLDAIALQTSSEWKYDSSSKYFSSDVKSDKPVDGPAIFEFLPAKRAKLYQVTLAAGWTTTDKGSWVMHSPPKFPIGMDIYEMGTYSQSGKPEKDFAEKIRAAVALQWAQRVHPAAEEKDMKPAKVGDFDALFYETLIPSKLNKDLHWRQWVFMDGNRCYFVVSTILPEMDAEIFPDVEKMLKSFKATPGK